jgi:hypothetical protein
VLEYAVDHAGSIEAGDADIRRDTVDGRYRSQRT